MTISTKTRVLVVDDSALVRRMLSRILGADPGLEVVGTATDPVAAGDKIRRLNPDVLTLDVDMPKMDGISFLRNLMQSRPMPVVMVSSLTEKGAHVTLEALELGAIDFVSKPKIDLAHTLEDFSLEIIGKVKVAARARVRPLNGDRRRIEKKLSAAAVLNQGVKRTNFKTTEQIVAIGASTGGTEAIKEVLMGMPADAPGVVITQHIPEPFSASFTQRMDSISAMTVVQATNRQPIVRGHVYIAPGDQHLLVARDGARYVCRLNDGPPVNRHRPSVDVLFRSVAQNAGKNSIGVLLTGMGTDGALGMKEIHEAGAPTVAQDEKTSVVWGMPGEAVKLGAVDTELPLHRIPRKILSLVR